MKHGEFPTWKTIKLGIGPKTDDDFEEAIKRVANLDDDARHMLRKPDFVVDTLEKDLELIKVSAADLGFRYEVTRHDLYPRAIALGLELCPPDVGPQLRLQYPEQPWNEGLYIAMNTIKDSIGFPCVFYLSHNDRGLWLGGIIDNPGEYQRIYRRWVFARRK